MATATRTLSKLEFRGLRAGWEDLQRAQTAYNEFVAAAGLEGIGTFTLHDDGQTVSWTTPDETEPAKPAEPKEPEELEEAEEPWGGAAP